MKNDDKRATDSLKESIRHSISIIEGGIKDYVYQEKDFAYRSVVTELRKLLVDKGAVSSFKRSIIRAKTAKSLLELCYGNRKNINLRSFVSSKKTETDEYLCITPSFYRNREDILFTATHVGDRVSLRQWLEEDLAYTKTGQILKVGTAIRRIAGREGTHIINPVGDEREDIAIAFLPKEPKPEDIPNIDFNHTNPWRQFVIDAGMRLLSAEFTSGKRLFTHSIDIPEESRTQETIQIQKKRKTYSL